ncbi:MAG: class I SAM-dependent methyltransferase [Candidatus Nanoarchaeia archaeon]|nr:class I SAM-dependent methyltransferase [Candidatus Nanoarchaeia archaeon]
MMHKNYDDVEKGYDYLSKYWKNEANGAQMTEFKPFFKMIGNVKNKKVLDAGCGTGDYAILLQQKGATVFGIDLSKGMINYAKKSAKEKKLNIFFQKADVCSLPFEDNYFDKIIIARVLGHVSNEDMKIAAKELMRVLKPKGEIIVSMIHPNLGNISNLIVNGKIFHMPRFNRTVKEYVKIFSEFKGKIVGSGSFKIVKSFGKISKEAYDKLKGKDFIEIFKVIKNN